MQWRGIVIYKNYATDEEVKSSLERKKVNVVNIKRVSAEESTSNSYHVIVDYYKFRFLAHWCWMQEVSQEKSAWSMGSTTIYLITMNIMSFNCEGLRICDDYIYHMLQNTYYDILCLQETWTLDTIIDILGTIHDNYVYTWVSGVSNEQFICGRLSGGLKE